MSLASTALLGVQGLLGLAMAGSGGMKLAGADQAVEDFERFGYPQWFRGLTGSLELLAAVGLFASFVTSPEVALGAALVVVGVMVGALLTHVRAGDSPSEMAPPAVILVIALVLSAFHAGYLG
jgi:hypothetical protein